MPFQGGGGRIGTKPGPGDPPPRPGDFIEIVSTGRDPLYWKADGDLHWKRVEVDPRTGKRGFRVPRGARGVTVSDRRIPNPAVVWLIVVEEKP